MVEWSSFLDKPDSLIQSDCAIYQWFIPFDEAASLDMDTLSSFQRNGGTGGTQRNIPFHTSFLSLALLHPSMARASMGACFQGCSRASSIYSAYPRGRALRRQSEGAGGWWWLVVGQSCLFSCSNPPSLGR